jgi:hypothetical protein
VARITDSKLQGEERSSWVDDSNTCGGFSGARACPGPSSCSRPDDEGEATAATVLPVLRYLPDDEAFATHFGRKVFSLTVCCQAKANGLRATCLFQGNERLSLPKMSSWQRSARVNRRRVKLLSPTANAQADEACGTLAIGSFRRLTARLPGPKLCLSPQPHRVHHELRPPDLATLAHHPGSGRPLGRRIAQSLTRVAQARSRTSQSALVVLILPADEVFGTHSPYRTPHDGISKPFGRSAKLSVPPLCQR